MLLPQGFGLIRASFPPEQYASAFAVFGPVFGLGGILGPVVGGAIIQANILDLGWRSVFLVNIPLGVVASIIAWKILPRTPGDKSIKIDLVGTAIILVSSALLIYPLIQGQTEGWPLWIWAMQRFSAARGGTSLIDARIFKKRAYTVGVSAIALFFAGMVGMYLIITLFLQVGHGFSAGDAGLWNIPIALGSAIGGTLSGAFLAEKLGRAVFQLGVVLQAIGAGLLWFAVTAFAEFNVWQLVPGMGLAGLGTGLVIAALFDKILSSVDDELVGSASGVLSAIQSIASSLGVAVFGTIFFDGVAKGQLNEGFTNTLMMDFAFLAGFAALTFFFSKKN
jgi:MFS family permease